MNIREEMMADHSRAQAEKMAKWIGTDKERFALLMSIFLHEEFKLADRAGWIMSIVAEEQQGIVMPYLDKMLARICEPGATNAMKRSVVQVLQHIDIPGSLQGDVMNICFNLLADPAEAIAVRCFSMTTLANLAVHYPDIKGELTFIIEDALQHNASAGFKSRAKKTLKALTKL